MEEVSQIQDDAVSSNDLNSSNLLNNLAHWDVGNMASNAFSEIYTQEGDDDDVLPFEALLDTKSNDATNNHIETPWIDGSSSSCDNIGTSLACVERDDFQVLQSLGVVETSSSSKYILGANNQLSLSLSTSVNESSLLSENTEFPSKVQSEVNSNAHLIFLNSPRTTRQIDQTSQFNVTVSRTTFENCVKNIKNNFINDNFGQSSSKQGSLFDLEVEGADIIQKSFETSGRASGNLSVGDAMCMDGPSDVFGADESSNSFLDGSNHSTAESTSLQTQYGNQLIYADLSGAASKDSSFQNNSALFLNSLHLPRQQHIVISSEGQQKIILQNQPKPHLLKQLAQQPSASINQHFILHQTPNQVVSPQLHTVFQQLKMPQQIIRTTFNKNQLENTSNLLSGHIALNKLSVEDQQGSNLIMANIKSTKPPRNRNQVNRSGRTDVTVGGKPNTTGPTNEKDSQELERVMNILKHYKQQIASNDQESQFLPCKRKRSKPPESICTSASGINNLSKLVTTAVIPNLNLSFNLSIKSNDSKSDNLTSNSAVKANSDLGSLIVSNPEQMNIYAVSNSATKMLATSAVQTVNSFVSTQANIIPATMPLLTSSCSQNFPFPLQLPVSNALGRAQSLLNSLQNNTPTTLQLSFKNLTKLVGLSSGNSPTFDKILSNEIVQTKVIKSLSSGTAHQNNSQTQSSQQQIHNVSQALITLHQLNSNQKLSNSQQIFINSLLQKNLPQLLHLSVRHSSTTAAQSSAVHSISQNVADVSINSVISSLPSPEQPSLSNRGINQLLDSFKTSKVSTQPSTSNYMASINTNIQMNSIAQSLKNGINYSDDLEAAIDDTQTTVELPTVDSINSSVAYSHNNTQSGDAKLNAVLNLPCNKVKLELNKKLKASPLSRVSTIIASTSPPIPVKNVQPLDRRQGSSAPYNKMYADNNLSLEMWPNKIDEDVETSDIISSVFGGCKSLDGVKDFLKKSFKVEESAIRIEKLKKAESKNDANSWDPTPKSILKRIGPEEKILCLVAADEASDDEELSIIGLVLWEGVEEQLVNTAFDCLFTLFQVETDKKRKSRSDKNSNNCNAVWNLNNKDLVSLKLTSLEIIPKQQRVKDSCDVIHQLASKVSKTLSQLLENVCQNENLWTEATLLSNNSEEFGPNTDDLVEIFCYVPLKCRTTDDAKSRRDLGIWRVFPGCILNKTDEGKESSQKKTNSNRNRFKVEAQGSTYTDQEHFTSKDEATLASRFDVQPRSQTNESKKLKNRIEEKVDFENDDFWADKISDSSTNKKKRKLQEPEPTLKLKIKKISSEDRSSIEADDTDQGTDDGKPERAKPQHYYCVRPRRQKSQRQIEHEQLQQQQRMTRNCNSRGRQRQQRADENSAVEGKSKGLSKTKETSSKVDQDCRSPDDEVSKVSNADTRNRLTMKLRDKISPRTSYASGVFMALTQGSIYLEVPKQNFNSTSLTNCSTNQLCLRLCRRKTCAKNENQESKSSINSPVPDLTELSDLIKQENSNLGSTSGSHFAMSLHEEETLTESNTTVATSTYSKDRTATTVSAAHAIDDLVESQDISYFGVISNPATTMSDLTSNKSEASDYPHQPMTTPLTDFLQLPCEGSVGMPLLDVKIKTYTAAPVNCAITMTTDTLVTKWIKPKLATTGPYPCWD